MVKFNSKEELQEFLIRNFPLYHSSPDQVSIWLKANGFEYSELTDGIIYASVVFKRFTISVTKFLIRIIFTTEKVLNEIIFEEGIIAP